MHAPEDEVKKYTGRYSDGFEPIRAARYKRAVQLGLLDSSWKMSPGAVSWKNNQHKAWDIRCMEVYAAMVDRMDQGIGKIVNELKRNNAFENTLILYLQDNGGCAEPFGRRSNADKIAGKITPT